ncbi:Zinc finger and BTB domain-containing protein [Paragonimus heterotremus]|uniref:Zinc finger and BTB domain-containing protein n=1 Tax=Paragonimus heterotremus TaxID=100268 RepID=A0A8J4T6X7_9TREM|nr:Zinc finger and BTB domain-containing protein [Paragonimus heterotremus]
MQVYFTLVKKLSKYTWSIQKYRLNEASSVGQSFADACDEGMVPTFPLLLVIGEVVSLCCLCGKTFTSQSLLHKHFELMHEGTEIDTEQYDLSGFTGVSDTPTSSGTTDDSRFRVLTCAFCNKVFTKICNLNTHIKTVHKGVKPFECTFCYKGFTRNSDLHKHIDAVHKGLKPFVCDFCQRSFSQKSSLKRHVEAIHEDPRNP